MVLHAGLRPCSHWKAVSQSQGTPALEGRNRAKQAQADLRREHNNIKGMRVGNLVLALAGSQCQTSAMQARPATGAVP